MPTPTEETAEAICGGLHRGEFMFLGETAKPLAAKTSAVDHGIVTGGLTTWWTIGHAPEIVRVAVIRDDPRVRVVVEYPVLAPPRILRSSIAMAVDTSAGNRAQISERTVRVVERCLEIYRDVLLGVGVADPRRATAPRA